MRVSCFFWLVIARHHHVDFSPLFASLFALSDRSPRRPF